MEKVIKGWVLKKIEEDIKGSGLKSRVMVISGV